MLIRVSSSEGMARVKVNPDDTISKVIAEIAPKWNVPDASSILLCKERGGEGQINPNATVGALGLSRGAMLYAIFSEAPQREQKEKEPELVVVPDPVDELLEKQDGWIQVVEKQQACFKHPDRGSCVHCMPIAPWNMMEVEPYKSRKLKHLPFTAFLRQHLDANKGRPLNVPDYTPASRSEPWRVQANSTSIRVSRQAYRHVDRVLFQGQQVLAGLVNYWRQHQTQRGGFLYGRYVPSKRTPLGIEAVVEAIYEAPQRATPNGFQLEEDDRRHHIDEVAARLGLVCVGFAFTAIESEGGKILQSRDVDKTFLVTGAELIQAAMLQNERVSPCKHSDRGYYGSKFVSVLITGDAEGQIGTHAFQASDQCMEMVKCGVISPHSDPRCVQVADLESYYMPRVLYDDTNEYKRTVLREAAPWFPHLPFWVDVGNSIPKKPTPLFPSVTFPATNRIEAPQNAEALGQQLHAKSRPLRALFSDFNFLVYLSTILDEALFSEVCANVLNHKSDSLKAALVQLTPLVPSDSSQQRSSSSSHSSSSNQAQRIEWMNTLMAMGYSAQQAGSALDATGGRGIEAAIDHLLG